MPACLGAYFVCAIPDGRILVAEHPLSNVGGAAVSSGTGAVSGSAIGSDPRHYIVDLTSVANAQTLTVTLTNITDTNGRATPSLSVSIGFLLGDSNGDRVVNSGDAQQTRNRSGQTTGASSFRSDYNLDGTINSGDATIVRTRSGQFIP